MRTEIFITDGHWRKSLAAVRSLGMEGLRITVGESTRLATAKFSRYCRRSVVYPSVIHQPSEFLGYLRDILSKKPFQMLLPMEDETVQLSSQHLNEFSRLTFLPFIPFS